MLIVCPSCAAEYMLADDKIGADGRRVRCSSCRTVFEVQPPPPPVAEEDDPFRFPSLAEIEAEEVPTSPEVSALIEDEWSKAALDEPEVAVALASGSQPAQMADQGVEVEADPDLTPPEPPPPPVMPRDAAPKVKRLSLIARLMAAAAGPLRLLASPGGVALVSFALIGVGVWQRDKVVRMAPSLAGLYELVGLPTNIRGLAIETVRSELATEGTARFMVVEGTISSLSGARVAVPLIELVVRDARQKPLYTWTLEPPRPSLIPGDTMRFRARLASPPEEGHDVMVRFAAAGPKGSAELPARDGGKSAAVKVTSSR